MLAGDPSDACADCGSGSAIHSPISFCSLWSTVGANNETTGACNASAVLVPSKAIDRTGCSPKSTDMALSNWPDPRCYSAIRLAASCTIEWLGLRSWRLLFTDCDEREFQECVAHLLRQRLRCRDGLDQFLKIGFHVVIVPHRSKSLHHRPSSPRRWRSRSP